MWRLLRDKAITNLDAALILKEQPNRHHCSSIHCSYYSCFQAIKYIIISDLGLSDADIITNREKESYLYNGKMVKPSEHDFLITYLHKNIIYLKELKDAQMFSENMNKLKSLRNNSDYKPILIEKDKSDNALNYAETVHKILKRIYKYDQN
jgi:hypothetical protein